MIKQSFIIPAYNEESYLEKTLLAIQRFTERAEIIVIDDGSQDNTKLIAERYADKLITFPENMGKGFALQAGWKEARGDIIICLDADLGESAEEIGALIEALEREEADLVISVMKPGKKAGFGLVKRRVQAMIYRKTGVKLASPLSGQRVFRRKWLPVLLEKDYKRFGVEAQMTLDLLRAGATCQEMVTRMTHREMGKNIRGFLHRLKQWLEIERQLREAQ
ncbi:glycosyltransferase family 2 protein [Halalkalibacter oceani]|uniref:glycosyltransferase family 2 protein n=1 Tax=Halalkalibacter oceani TaxID=1653776 RepID=UPI003390F0D3